MSHIVIYYSPLLDCRIQFLCSYIIHLKMCAFCRQLGLTVYVAVHPRCPFLNPSSIHGSSYAWCKPFYVIYLWCFDLSFLHAQFKDIVVVDMQHKPPQSEFDEVILLPHVIYVLFKFVCVNATRFDRFMYDSIKHYVFLYALCAVLSILNIWVPMLCTLLIVGLFFICHATRSQG